MVDEKDLLPPEPTVRDRVDALARAGVADILPAGGSSAAEILSWVVAPSFERRLNAWRQRVGESLIDLAARRGVVLEDLRENPGFVDAVLQATQAALRTSREKKLEALRNAVCNAALPEAPPEALQQVFFTLVDELSEWHLAALDLFENPRAWAEKREHVWPKGLSAGRPTTVLRLAFPELKQEEVLAEAVWGTITQRGLMETTDAGYFQTRSGTKNRGLTGPGLTSLGKAFIRFIREPQEE